MTTCKPAPNASNRTSQITSFQPARQEIQPDRPDKQLWKADKDRAFDASVKWFLSVSQAA